MVKSSFIILFSGLLCLIFTSSAPVTPAAADPGDFAKLFVDALKKNDRDFYLTFFELSPADVEWVKKNALADPYILEDEKAAIKESLSDTAQIKDGQHKRFEKSFEAIQTWIRLDTIDVNKIEFAAFYFELHHKKSIPFSIINDADLYVKCGTRFYRINFDDIVFINNHWKHGEIRKIEEVDKYLNYISFDEGTEYEEDYPAYTEDAVGYDTLVYAADTLKMGEPYYDNGRKLSDKQNKKINKIEKKLFNLYLKREQFRNKPLF